MRKSSSNRKTKRSLKGSIKRRSRRGIKSKRFRGGNGGWEVFNRQDQKYYQIDQPQNNINVHQEGKQWYVNKKGSNEKIYVKANDPVFTKDEVTFQHINCLFKPVNEKGSCAIR
jgi:hypothetical protein